MKNALIYDIPTRLFHWLFSGLFVAAFAIGKTVDDDSVVFSYHMMLGMTLALTIILRIFWGLLGSRYAKFSSFPLSPVKLFEYLKEMLSGKTKIWTGHNPASSWAAIVMMALGLGLAGTGYLMSTGSKEAFEDIHEIFANLFLFVTIGHILGIVFHTIRHKDPIALSMVTGTKAKISPAEAIGKSHAMVGLVFLVIVGAFGANLARGFDPVTRQLSLFGQSLSLGENEADEKSEGTGEHKEGAESEDDDD